MTRQRSLPESGEAASGFLRNRDIPLKIGEAAMDFQTDQDYKRLQMNLEIGEITSG